MMDNTDFRELILQKRDNKGFDRWVGSALDYLQIVRENPLVAQFAPGRVYNMLLKHGTKPADNELKTYGYEDLAHYGFFDGKIFGTLEPIHDILQFLKASARRTETGKRILILVGPVSSGKSTIATLLKRGLEADDTPIYRIKGCPLNEEPLHLIPLQDRFEFQEKLGVKIEGSICPTCQFYINQNYADPSTGEINYDKLPEGWKDFITRNDQFHNGYILWEEVPVERFYLNEQQRVGIGTFLPSDPKSQDISELLGSINMSKVTRFGEGDPRAYQFNGEMQVANRGLLEYIEMLKADIKFHYALITAAQEQTIKAPRFPQMYIDTLILAHTNQTEFDIFKAEKKNEALHDRMYPILVPWNVRVNDEIKIYEKLIAESDFTNIHIAPHTLRVAAQFAVLTRLYPSNMVSSLVEKMKLYNGEIPTGFKKEEVDMKALRMEGKKNGEGMSGISPRFIINAINIILAAKEDKKCINPIDLIRSLRSNFDHHIGARPEEVQKYMEYLIGEKDSITAEYKTIAKQEVNKAFLSAFDEQAETLFQNYIINAEAFCKNEKVEDRLTGEYAQPDEKLMRAVEEIIGIPQNSKKEFRNGIFVHKSSCLERSEAFTYQSYAPLREAIEKKLLSDAKNLVSLTLCDPTKVADKKIVGRRNMVLKRLKEQGYCESCANTLLQAVGDILRREE